MRRFSLFAILLLSLLFAGASGDEVRYAFAVIGDAGCGCEGQSEVAERMQSWHRDKPFSTVLMLGDNIYGNDPFYRKVIGRRTGGHRDLFVERFDRPYKPLQEEGVKFYAVLGNHDLETFGGQHEIEDRERFNILDKRGYYSFSVGADSAERPLITFFAVDSNRLIRRNGDIEQVQWLKKALAESTAIWKIVYLHHPLYTPAGKHRPEYRVREILEPLLLRGRVNVVLSGHNHFYARMHPRHGITYFISGGGGKSLKKPLRDRFTAHVERAYHFLYMEVDEEKIDFQAVPAEGDPFDEGTITHAKVH